MREVYFVDIVVLCGGCVVYVFFELLFFFWFVLFVLFCWSCVKIGGVVKCKSCVGLCFGGYEFY